jgi:predicted porin
MMRRRQGVGLSVALSVAGAAIATPASAADDPAVQRQLKSVLEQLRAVSQQNQQQIDALTRQLQDVQQRNQREVGTLNEQLQTLQQQLERQPNLTQGPLGKAPPADARNVIVTQQPGNLPGRSVVPPYTAAGAATPGTVPPTSASPVASGSDRVKLSISGQVDRALLYGNDGKASNLRNVDNNISSTRLRFVGEGHVTDTTTGGTNLEAEIRPNSSSTTTLTQNLPQPAAAATFTVRHAEGYVQDPDWGAVRLGFGATATYLTSEVDLSGSFTATYVNVPDIDGGFAFRQRGAARVPASATTFVTSPDGAFGPAVGAVYNFFDGLVRDNRIRYDTPVFGGFQFATSLIDGGAFDAAVRYAAKFDGHQLAAAVGFVDADSRRHIPIAAISGFPGAPANLYGYAGVPTGSNGTANLATPVTPNAGDVGANGSKQFDGSFSFLMDNGLSLTMAGGYRNVNYKDPIGRKLSPLLLYTKLGYRFAWLPYGDTAVGIDFTENEEVQFHGDTARAYGIGVVQFVESLGTELFAVAKYETLQRTFARYDDLTAISTGARVRF